MVAALLLSAAPLRAAVFDYLHVEANEGGSSGGHVALAIGDDVFHFQHGSGGLLALRRDRRQAFRVRYTLLENRPVHVTHLAADAATVERLRAALARRAFIEDGERRQQAGLAADVALFDLAADGAADAAWPVRGAGYFLADVFVDGGAGTGASPALAALRARVAGRHGGDAIARRLAALRAALAALPLRAAAPAAATAAGTFAIAPPTAATRLGELLEQVTALEVLAAAPALRADALVAASAPLTEAERAALRRWAASTTAALADLVASPRPDWGWAMLLGMARLAAIEASLAAGRLRVLDAWPADARRPPLPGGPQRDAFFAALAAHAARLLERARGDCLRAADCVEAGYARLEAAVNRAADVTAARAASLPPRVAPAPFLPARPARRRDLVVALPPPAAAAASGRAARAAAAAARDRVAAWRGYRLISRNCVTELFDLVETGAGDRGGGMRAALGGSVARAPWNAVPFVAAAAVAASPRVVGRETWPSHRQETRRRRLAREPGATAWLGELTAATASGYRPGPDDSTFVFFTDDTLAARPLLGAVNLAAAGASAVLGLLTWPADGGSRLQAGARGALYSLPELAFVNIRKGTTAWLTPDELPEP